VQNIPAVLSDEENAIVRVGLASATLLSDGNFADVIKAVMLEAFAAITDSKPDQLAAREHNYNLIRGLKAIEAELETRVQAKDAIERRMDAENANDADPLIDDAELGVTE
jgi:hypothetical protein